MFNRLFVVALGAVAVTNCAGLPGGEYPTPPLSPMEDPRALYQYQPVLMPEPAVSYQGPNTANSLWQTGARSFFNDPRAQAVGDILTVLIEINDSASVSNTTNRTRNANSDADLSTAFGVEGLVGETLGRALPGGFTPSGQLDLSSSASNNGTGSIDRSESIDMTAAAVVTDVLPNGNLVIAGRQEVRINSEKRELYITGIVRPEDITAANTVRHTQIAEARISYGGEGVISEFQNPRYGQRWLTRASPF